jgi:D-proline reductase (dithiol) PrdB
MATLDELPLGLRLFMKTYPWRRIRPVPFIRPDLPVSRSRVALVSSAGFILPGQEPFDETVKGGDFTYRVLPSDADPRSLINTHRSESFDPSGIEADPNLGIPLERMRELADDGTIGEFSPRAYSVMGSITAPGRFIRESAPRIAEALRADAADAVLLVPL